MARPAKTEFSFANLLRIGIRRDEQNDACGVASNNTDFDGTVAETTTTKKKSHKKELQQNVGRMIERSNDNQHVGMTCAAPFRLGFHLLTHNHVCLFHDGASQHHRGTQHLCLCHTWIKRTAVIFQFDRLRSARWREATRAGDARCFDPDDKALGEVLCTLAGMCGAVRFARALEMES